MDNTSKSRIRVKSIKKWSKSEVIRVLDYILQTGKFEKPTAQVYYNKLIADTRIAATWDMLRWKMRNLRVTFQKCNDWLRSNEAKMLEAEEGYNGICSKIQRMCPHYENLKEIYREKCETAPEVTSFVPSTFLNDEFVCVKSEIDCSQPIVNSTYPVYDTAAASSPTISTCGIDDDSGVTKSVKNIPAVEVTPTITTTTTSATTTDICTEHKDSSSSCALIELSKLQFQRNLYYSKKIEIQQDKINKDFLIEERKIQLEEAKLKLEEEKFRANLELRKAELEKEERIAKYEIEMKYKIKD